MDMYTCGKPGNPVVLLLPDDGADHAAVFTALHGLEKSYYLMIPAFSNGEDAAARAAALEKILVRDHAGRVWGAYGLRAGAGVLLSLFSRGTVRVRTLILEGAYVPADTAPAAEKIICWKGSKDKGAKKSWKALDAQVSPLSSLTMKKLTKEQDLLSLRPDLMVKQLKKALGKAVIVTRSAVLSQPADRVWEQLTSQPDQQDAAALAESDAPRRIDACRTLILEGRSPRLKHWSHLTHVEALGINGAVCTDQVELDAGVLNFAVKPLTGLRLKQLQRRREKTLRKSSHAV